MTSQLPERANLEQLKKQAKSLLHEARAQDQAALQRFQLLPALSRKSLAELGAMTLALHDAQSVIAREYGFKSWNEMRDHVEERSLSFGAAVDELVRCATGGAHARAFRLLALHPAIARANLYTELVLGDVAGVKARLQKNPEAARQRGGVQNWEPLLYVCQTCLHKDAPERIEGLVAIARELLALGADPNGKYDFHWHAELPRTVLWGALCAVGHLPLAEVLLEGGANPTDGVSTHINAGMGNLAALELLHRYGLNVNGIPGGVPPLRYIMSWGSDQTGLRWLLEHGADPNLSWGELDDAPLHLAAQRWNLAMVELLVRHGADVNRRRKDGSTPHTLAEMHGNHEIAAWLLEHGARDELSPLERFVAACAQGNRARADALLESDPALRSQLRKEHHLMLMVPAERGDGAVLETMLARGFDPGVADHDVVTPLHQAAMHGRVSAAQALLANGAPVNALDGMFSANPLLWAAEGWGHHASRNGADHPGVARLLIAAGSSLEWAPPEKAPHPEGTQEQLVELCRAAAAHQG